MLGVSKMNNFTHHHANCESQCESITRTVAVVESSTLSGGLSRPRLSLETSSLAEDSR